MKSECEAVFLFITELTGTFVAGSGNEETKIKCGQQCYFDNYLHDLDLGSEEDRKDVHENVWLERLYEELDRYFDIVIKDDEELLKTLRYMSVGTESYREDTYQWTVPIELDASASMLQYMGILLNDERLMRITNVIGDVLEDPWNLEGMTRKMLKTAATPMLYGSSQTCNDLWKKEGIEYTSSDVEMYTKEMGEGPFGLANEFKNFIINNCKPKPVMKLNIWKDKFEVSCNRYRNVGEKTKAYKLWDTIDQQYNVVLHTDTKKVPDLERFRAYFCTGIIHNLDSQVMNNVMEATMDKYGWAIPVHDAAIVSPAAAAFVRQKYAESMEEIHANRNEILVDYFNSIGIDSRARQEWFNLKSKVVEFQGEFKCSSMALK